jgi:hypothetical protein
MIASGFGAKMQEKFLKNWSERWSEKALTLSNSLVLEEKYVTFCFHLLLYDNRRT